MKRRPRPEHSPSPSAPIAVPVLSGRIEDLVRALRVLDSPEELRRFLVDLCTPAELEAMADRWAVVPELAEGRAYRDIHDRTGVSVTTVGRVARCLSLGAGGYRIAAERLGHLAPGAAFAAPLAERAAPSVDDTH